jgi:hypothetical protein
MVKNCDHGNIKSTQRLSKSLATSLWKCDEFNLVLKKIGIFFKTHYEKMG